MTETEGVIKYQLDHQDKPIDKKNSLSEINAWRTLLFKLQLIGQIENRYEAMVLAISASELTGLIQMTHSL